MSARVAIVFDGSRGIASALVLRLAKDGFDVELTYLASAEAGFVTGSAITHQRRLSSAGRYHRKMSRKPCKGSLRMPRILFAAAIALAAFSAESVSAAPAANADPQDAPTLNIIRSQFGKLVALANRHDLKALHEMFWQSPSALLVAKSAIPSEGNWAGFWGNDAIDQKLHDIAASGPVVLQPDFSKLKVVDLTPSVAETYAPMNITVSYAGQGGTPKPFLMIIDWIKVGKDWKVASEIILPVPPAPRQTPHLLERRQKVGSVPPSRMLSAPITNPPRSEARKHANSATSSGVVLQDCCRPFFCQRKRVEPRRMASIR